MGSSNKYSSEVRERAVRMVLEHQSAHDSQWAAIGSIAEKIGCTSETLCKWVRQAERDEGRRAGLRSAERERLKANDGPGSTCNDSFSGAFGDILDDDNLLDGDADGLALSFSASRENFGEFDVDLSSWAPLLGMLDSTEPEESPDDRPFTPSEGVEGAHALELRAESILQYCERGAVRTGESDRTEVGDSDDNRDVVAGRDEVEIDGMLDEHTGHGLVHVADDVEMNVRGRLRMHAHVEDNIIMGGVMTDEWKGGAFICAAMSDDMAAGLGLRCTAPLDLWVHGLAGMEERPGTCAADGILCEFAGTLYERESGPSVHSALVARLDGTVATTMKTGFRPLFKTAIGVRNLIPGGGGGSGDASASAPAAPPASAGGEPAGAVTLTAAGSGGALGHGVARSGDTEDIMSAARVAGSASESGDVESLRHPADTAENIDSLARIDVEGTGYQQVADIYEQPVPASAVSEPDGGALVEPHNLEGNPELNAWGDGRVEPDIGDPGGACAPATDAHTPLPSRRPANDSTPTSNPGLPDSVFATPRPAALDLTEPGTEGYDFAKSYDLLRNRQQHYRDHAMWRGNLALTEAVEAIDKRALELLTGLGGSVDDIAADASTRTPSIRDALEAMAELAEENGRADRLMAIQDAIAELDGLVHGAAIDLAARADEFSGAALGAQRVPIDSHIDTELLRGWLDEQLTNATVALGESHNIADPDAMALAAQRAGWEMLYFEQMIQSLDKDISPLATSSEMIAYLRAKGSMAQIEFIMELEAGLVTVLSDPTFIRSIAEMGADTFTPFVRVRIDAGLDLLGPDSLRLPGAGEVPPPLPATSRLDSASYVDEVRDRNFSRSALEASAETLERRVLDFSERDASGPTRAPFSGVDSGFDGTLATSPGSHRTPPDNAQAPIIDEQSGLWVVESSAESETSRTTSDSASPHAHRDGASPQASPASWDSGLPESAR